MDLLPTLLRIHGRKCLVVGSNSSAMQQASALLEQGALVTVVASGNSEAKAPTGCDLQQRSFLASDLDEPWLVIAASDSTEENDTIRHACEARQLFCSVINDRDSSTFVSDLSSSNPTKQHSTLSPKMPATAPTDEGFVSLVGAGPGDPDLLTLRALKLIQTADVIVHDRLVSPQIIELCRPDAEFIYAGKAKSNHAIPQDSINQLLVNLAQQKRQVVRLKGGDPFIFGRGGEEIETLSDHHIPFQVVPGITAASGCAAFAGIPLTHREHAQSCVFVTGHLKDGQINLNWQDLRDPSQTIVVYMGLTGVKVICESLIQHGRSEHTPAALIEQGTTPNQRVLSSTLARLPALVESTQVVAPTLLIIGGVVTLRDKLKWFKS